MRIKSRYILLFSLLLLLTGCSQSGKHMSAEKMLELISKDMEGLYYTQELEKPITVNDAIARALKYNIDARLLEYEQIVAEEEARLSTFDALPNLTAQTRLDGRDNERASSSRSVETGTESLEPSVSLDRYRYSGKIEADLNLIDTSLAIVRTKQLGHSAQIAAERRRKVAHTIAQETRRLFWWAATAQLLDEEIKVLLKKGQGVLVQMRQAESEGLLVRSDALQKQSGLLTSLNELMEIRSRLAYSKEELSTFINIPPGYDFKLSVEEKDFTDDGLAEIKTPLEELILVALVSRPEIIEEGINNAISEKDRLNEILQALPGIGLRIGQEYDTNSFLVNRNWTSYSIDLSQNLIRLFTLPMRLNALETRKELERLRRKAILSSVIAQVFLAHKRVEIARDSFDLRKQLYSVDRKIIDDALSREAAELLAETEIINVKVKALLSQLRFNIAFIEVQDAQSSLIKELGIDVLPDTNTEKDLEAVSEIVEARYLHVDDAIIKKYVEDIKTIMRENEINHAPIHNAFTQNKLLDDNLFRVKPGRKPVRKAEGTEANFRPGALIRPPEVKTNSVVKSNDFINKIIETQPSPVEGQNDSKVNEKVNTKDVSLKKRVEPKIKDKLVIKSDSFIDKVIETKPKNTLSKNEVSIIDQLIQAEPRQLGEK